MMEWFGKSRTLTQEETSVTQKFAVGDKVLLVAKSYTYNQDPAYHPGGTGVVTETISNVSYPFRVLADGAKNTTRGFLFTGSELELIKTEEKAVEQLSTFKVGDRVVALEDYSFDVKEGETYTVRSVSKSYDSKSNGMIALEGSTDGIFGMRLKLAETKQEETVQQFKKGDIVEVIESGSGVVEGQRYVVKSCETRPRPLLTTECGVQVFASRFKLVEPKPKKQSSKITLEEVRVGDTLACFWNQNGVEYRQKGTVARINEHGYACTAEDNYLTHVGGSSALTFELEAEHIYLIERPEVKEPELADGTYYVTSIMEGVGPWQVTVANGVADWKYGDKWQNQAYSSYESLVQAKKGLRSDMVFHTEDPTPAPKPVDGMYRINEKEASSGFEAFWSVRDGVAYEGHTREAARSQGHPVNVGWFKRMFAGDTHAFNIPVLEPKTDLELHTEAGYVGNIYVRPNNTPYKVTEEGKVMAWYKDDNKWSNISWDFGTFHRSVEAGAITKIS